MTSPVSLEALLRRMSRDAEKIFNKCGEVPMLWLLETADGEQKMLTTPLSIPPGMSPGDYKHHLDASLHDLFAREHVVRWSPGRPVRSWRFHYVAGIGRFDDGRLAEVFLTLPKPATAVEASARDAAIVASLALQYGVPLVTLQQALTRNGDGSPSSPLGRLLDLLASNAEGPQS
jgi:hypothetical protein